MDHLVRGVWPEPGINNFSVPSSPQAFGAGVNTYVSGSSIGIPAGGVKVGTVFTWVLNLTKDANGVASSAFTVVFGKAKSTSDPVIITFTKPGGSAAADKGQVTITCVVQSVSATGVIVGNFQMTHNLAATGHMTIPCAVLNVASSGFDNTVAGSFVGLCLQTGAADNVTCELCIANSYGY
jgi:hypothetical protein